MQRSPPVTSWPWSEFPLTVVRHWRLHVCVCRFVVLNHDDSYGNQQLEVELRLSSFVRSTHPTASSVYAIDRIHYNTILEQPHPIDLQLLALIIALSDNAITLIKRLANHYSAIHFDHITRDTLTTNDPCSTTCANYTSSMHVSGVNSSTAPLG
jgi:hypothetical protein